MITEDKVTEIFCIADDFCKDFEREIVKNTLNSGSGAQKRRRKRKMSDAEVITILICFHFNTFRNFKHYYLGCVCMRWRNMFPETFSYSPHNFIINLLTAMGAYCFFQVKPHVNFDFEDCPQDEQLSIWQ